ncbi:MAG: toll/interleukin-1 receptor domain-containing protein [Terracidiphilus sp.]
MARPKYDVFISHASEDKVAFVEPLAIALRKWGLKVWFDKFSLKVGDSLRDSIEMGLANSRYGAVVFSPSFLVKNWPKAELNGLFARQVQGKKKIILPIWHEITAAEMTKTMPIQVDSVALKSSEGVESVAKALVEVIRPKLLKLEAKKELTFEAAESFIENAKAEHPGYDFTVHSGEIEPATYPGTAAMIRSNSHRIDIKVSNAALIKETPKLKIAFKGQGGSKMLELLRTGKQQSWESGEFTYLGGSIPLMPHFAQEGGQLIIGPGNVARPSRPVRLEVGNSDPIVFPLMEMRPTRSGTEEAEISIAHSNSPLTISMVFHPSGKSTDCNFHSSLIGHSFTQCEKAIKAIDALRRKEPIRVIDIESEKVVMNGQCLLSNPINEPYLEDLRSLITLAAQIERHFSCRLDFPESISNEEDETLRILDCLLNNRQYDNGLTVTATIEKGDSGVAATQRPLFAGQPAMLFNEVENFPGYFILFGKTIPAPSWGLYTEQLVSREDGDELAKFDQAKPGDELEVSLTALTPTYARWKTSPESSATPR